jgi:flagellar hook-length control protein FliK
LRAAWLTSGSDRGFGGAAPTAEGAANHAAQSAQTGAALAGSGIPDDLRPLVQQQLDAAATQRLAWHGEVWPRQTMDWEIAHDETSASSTADGGDTWRTTVHLTLPRLGDLSARLAVSQQQVSLTVQAADAASATALQAHAPRLQAAFAATGLTLQRFDVRHGD